MARHKKFSARGFWEDQQPPLFIVGHCVSPKVIEFGSESFGKLVGIYEY